MSEANMQPFNPSARLAPVCNNPEFTLASLKLETAGAMLCNRAACSTLGDLRTIADAQVKDSAGVRLRGIGALRLPLTRTGALGSLAAAQLGYRCRPVRAILFDKTKVTNWTLGWHQDRTIIVRERRDTPGYGPWTIKAGMIHVAPPTALLARMLTMRIHLDDVPEDNAPLLIAPGSHRLGRVAERDMDRVVSRCGTIACLAEAGDVWIYSTLILHASAAASRPIRRRVLQIDFAAENLPGALGWLGI